MHATSKRVISGFRGGQEIGPAWSSNPICRETSPQVAILEASVPQALALRFFSVADEKNEHFQVILLFNSSNFEETRFDTILS